MAILELVQGKLKELRAPRSGFNVRAAPKLRRELLSWPFDVLKRRCSSFLPCVSQQVISR